MVLGTVIIYGVERPVLHYPMVAVGGVIVAANLFLVLELAHPYIGEVSTTSDPLQEVVWVLSQPSYIDGEPPTGIHLQCVRSSFDCDKHSPTPPTF